MSNTKGVKVVDGGGQLMSNTACQVLADNEFALVEEREEVSAV